MFKPLLLLFLLVINNQAFAREKILSLGGDVTEIIFALGHGSSVIATDSTSYFPLAAASLPKVGYLRQLSVEGILSLAPDRIVANSQAGPISVVEQLQQSDIDMLFLPEARDLPTVWRKVSAIGGMLGAKTAADDLIEQQRQQYERLQAGINKHVSRPKVLFLLQRGAGQSLAAGSDTAANAMISLAGGLNVFSGIKGYKPLNAEWVISAAPEIILVGTTPTSRQSLDESAIIDKLSKSATLRHTPAVRNGRVYTADTLTLLGFGPRTVDSLEWMYTLFTESVVQ